MSYARKLERVGRARAALLDARDSFTQSVRDAREAGAPVREIAESAGLSRQAVHKILSLTPLSSPVREPTTGTCAQREGL